MLLFGPLAAGLILFAIVGLALFVPGYNPIHQTVSEIGEIDSPMRVPFAVTLVAVATCLLAFAWNVRHLAKVQQRSALAAYFVTAYAISVFGVALFAFPHPMHNLFGASELVGYQAPFVMALTWRQGPQIRGLLKFSWLMAILVWLAIALNLTTFFRDGQIWAAIKPAYGLVQRTLFATWFVWAAGVGVLLFQSQKQPDLKIPGTAKFRGQYMHLSRDFSANTQSE